MRKRNTKIFPKNRNLPKSSCSFVGTKGLQQKWRFLILLRAKGMLLLLTRILVIYIYIYIYIYILDTLHISLNKFYPTEDRGR